MEIMENDAPATASYSVDDSGKVTDTFGSDDFNVPTPSLSDATIAAGSNRTDMFGGGGAGDFGLGFNPNAGKGIEGIDSTYQSNFQSTNLLNDQMANYYTKMRGATDTNPYPDSFFSRMLGVDKVNYTNILGGKEGVKRVNDLRARQAFGLPSLKTGELYQAGDYYIGQPTNMGEVKPIQESGLGISSLINMLPGGAALSAIMPQKGLPENDPRYRAIMEERKKSANDPTVFDRTSDFVKSILGFDPKDSGASLAVSPTGDAQFGVPDTRTFDAFGNVTGSDLDTEDRFKTIEQLAEERKKQNAINAISDMFQAKPKYEQQADLSQTFKNINDATKGVLGPDGMPVPFFNNEDFRLKLGIDREKQEPRATFTYNFPTV